MIATLAPVETRLAENPPGPRHQIPAELTEETLARRRDLAAFIGKHDVPHGHERVGHGDTELASQMIVATKRSASSFADRGLRRGGTSIAATTLMLSSIVATSGEAIR